MSNTLASLGETHEVRVEATRAGRWGIRQLRNGEPTGGGTINLGWTTRDEAEQANPPQGIYTYEPFERWA